MSLADDIAQEVRKALGLTAVETIKRITPTPRRSGVQQVPSRRVPTHAEREAFHKSAEARHEIDKAKICEGNAERLRKYVIDADAVLRTADLLCKRNADGTSDSVDIEQVALVTGLPENFCEKVIETKWVAAGAPPLVGYEGA
jgi:hypothetical protein